MSPMENARPVVLFISQPSVKQMVGFWYLVVISWKRVRKMGALRWWFFWFGEFCESSRFMFGLGIAI